MLILLSPAKSINYKSVRDGTPLTHSEFEDEADVLAKVIRTSKNVAKTLEVSDALGALNKERFDAWHPHAKTPEGERAAWVYRGEVYFGLSADSLSDEQLAFANDHVRIISGLYGLLRLTDVILPYRLEMKIKLKGQWGKNLYDFWGTKLADAVLKQEPSFILNCASQEYFKVIAPGIKHDLPVITPKFLHDGPTGVKPKMAFAKYSRGLMARWAIENKLVNPSDVIAFDVEGYRYSEDRSTPNEPVFIAPAGFTIKGRFTKT